jgi:hypothetical protein
MAIEQVGGGAQGARLPPGVVVAQRDVRRVDGADADVAGGAAHVAVEPDDLRGRSDDIGRAVGRRVVDDDDLRLLRQRGEPFERARQRVPPVAGRDDDRQPRIGGQEPSRRTSLKNVLSSPLAFCSW